MREVSIEGLKKISLDILIFIDAFCRNNEIEYFIIFGTLLGAVRHKGFIPWDDDIDVGMTRNNYNRFIELMQKQSKYNIICMETDPNYYFAFARVSDDNTILRMTHIREIHNLGVFVDIFPYDNCAPFDEHKAWGEECSMYRKKAMLTIPHTAHYHEHSFGTIARIIKKFPQRLYYGEKNFQFYCKQWQDCLMRYNNQESDCIVSQRPKFPFPKKIIKPFVELEFERHMFKAPADYHEYLRIKYGNDYMELPPVEQRVTKHHFKAYWR